MHSQFILHQFRKLLQGGKLLLGVMKQWNGERLKPYFYWTSIFIMGMNKAHVLLSCRWDFCQTWRPRKCEIILGVNIFSIKPYLKELSVFSVPVFFMVDQLDHKIRVPLSLFRSLLNLNEQRLGVSRTD